MTSFEKVVKLACKPKAAPPKAKYLEPIIAATWADEGSIHDVCKALSPRFREPNATVVFKALIVLHTMIRNGATDNVLAYLSTSPVLRLQNVSAGNWDGYNAPQNLQKYAAYLDTRIRAYREIQHDAIRVQSENNRDLRVSTGLLDGGLTPKNLPAVTPTPAGPSRRQTIIGRKLMIMTVEKGLLRETKVVQRMMDALVECRFYLDDLENPLIINALSMLVKDLLIVFQACNEGVMNVLKQYFAMSHIDALDALGIYRHFCKQADNVTEYLEFAKKLQNLLNVPIPSFQLAPVSLANALQEYVDDPNFERNRLEYRAKKTGGKGSAKAQKTESSSAPPLPTAKPSEPTTPAAAAGSSATSNNVPPVPSNKGKAQDLLTSIDEEEEQFPTPNAQTSILSAALQLNPFVQTRMTGAAFSINPFGQIQSQPVPMILPQQTGFPPNPFAPTPVPALPITQVQMTGPFLQPQMTGTNPFRQSMMFPQMTGALTPFGVGAGELSNAQNPFPLGLINGGPFGQQLPPVPPLPAMPSIPTGPSALHSHSSPNTFAAPHSAFAQTQMLQGVSDVPARPATSPPTNVFERQNLQPVKTHQTGTKNPFGVPVFETPPVPKPPTLMDLAQKGNNKDEVSTTEAETVHGTPKPQFANSVNANPSAFNPGGSAGGDMASVASSFTFNKDNVTNGLPFSGLPSLGSSLPNTISSPGPLKIDTLFSPLSNSPSTATTSSGLVTNSPTSLSPMLKPQTTGFGGIKPFVPSSSFGASLLGSLPPMPQSSSNYQLTSGGALASTGSTSSTGLHTFVPSFLSQPPNGISASTSAGTSSGLSNVGLLRPQTTGGTTNPFRASMFVAGPTPFGVPPSLPGMPQFETVTSSNATAI